MRNFLVPLKLAYYLPRFKGKPILPDNWTLPVPTLNLNLEFITPALERVPYVEINGAVVGKDAKLDGAEIRKRLKSLVLDFKRVLVSEGSGKIFGSVSAVDVQQKLLQAGIIVDVPSIQCRIKSTGEHRANITIENEDIEVLVRVSKQ